LSSAEWCLRVARRTSRTTFSAGGLAVDGWAAGAEDFWLIFTLLIAANRWYLFADPLATPVYVYGYLRVCLETPSI
jgi:hypothetical protein